MGRNAGVGNKQQKGEGISCLAVKKWPRILNIDKKVSLTGLYK
jgi:hypothetical protein